jgi:beta-lactamase class C
MDGQLLPSLGLKNTYIRLPATRTADYAQGYSKQNAPVRMKPDMLWEEAYGIRTTASDMNRFIAENMKLIRLEPALQRAITLTHSGYFTAGPLTQDLIWEQYPYPVPPKTVLDGNAQAMVLNATPATRITPPLAPRDDVWINKTGSTNGFGSYIAFIPQKRLGIVILANRNIPNEARVEAAYRILTALSAPGNDGK